MAKRTTSPRFAESRKATKLRMLSAIRRPSRIAATIVAKSSSVRTTSAASRAASVPLRPIATPTSARRSAGVSLTPSPVTATTSPRAWSASTSRSLSAGVTRAKTLAAAGASSRLRGVRRSSSAPVSGALIAEAERAGDRRGGDGVVAGQHRDVDTESARRAIEPAAAGRSGSWSPTRPTSSSSSSSSSSRRSRRDAGARRRRGRAARRSPSSRRREQLACRFVEPRPSDDLSGAPLTTTRAATPSSYTTRQPLPPGVERKLAAAAASGAARIRPPRWRPRAGTHRRRGHRRRGAPGLVEDLRRRRECTRLEHAEPVAPASGRTAARPAAD